VLGGWDLDGILRVQSGQSVAIGGNNLGRSAKIDNPTLARWFDTTPFINTPAFTIQTTGPRSPDVRNDYTRNLDVVMVKTFKPSIAEACAQHSIPGRVLQPVQHAAIQFAQRLGNQPELWAGDFAAQHLASVPIRA
jgi:hypothetical protein